ncbi:MFS-type transporter SLC18B1 [Galendromus occidentalis]|uniref:MFS-type transporter SLC18B1 n=1 Tax=Galendromus occidentalis TaxID=34638 RepID=A0AAJ6QPD7_9ACAR|nr:MFS-type transporter SLC18B1 [Galendromus occidentalis]
MKTKETFEIVAPERRFSKREFTIMFFLSVACLTEGSCFSHIAPFYAEESGKRDNDKTQFGIVFGIHPAVGFFMAPIVGQLLVKTVKAKKMLVLGMFLDGILTIVTGFLTSVPNGTPFFAAGLILRSVQSVGFSMAVTTYYAIIGAELGPWAHICLPIIETIYGASVVAGPAIGGFLYEHGGFRLPFFVLGSITTITAVFVMATFPTIDKGSEETKYSWAAVFDIRIILNVLMVMSTFIIVGFNDATLAINLQQFELSPTYTGLCFVVCGGLYSISSIFWGIMSKRVGDPRYFVVAGAALSCIAMAFVGPLPVLDMRPTLPLVLVMQAFMGTGYGPSFVCSFMHSLGVVTNERGLPDNLGTYAMLSGIFMPACFMGNAIGPMLGGFLVENYGYRNATVVVFSIVLVMLLMEVWSVLHDNCSLGWKKRTEQKPSPLC